MNILCLVYDNPSGSLVWRCVYPLKYLSENNLNVSVKFYDIPYAKELSNEELKQFHAAVFHSSYFDILFIQRLQNLGIKIITDFDDYWVLPKTHEFYQERKKAGTLNIKKELLQISDAFTTTNYKLYNIIKNYRKPVKVIPNAFDFSIHTIKPIIKDIMPRISNRLIFSYFGASNHINDLYQIRGIMSLNLDFELRFYMYPDKNELKKIIKLLYNNTHISDNRLKFYPPEDAYNYLKFYNDIDIVIAPLEENNWNSYKSELKLIEAGFFSKPVICSLNSIYKPIMQKGNFGFMANSYHGWLTAFKHYIQNPQFINEHGTNLNKYITENFHLKNWSEIRYNFYNTLN